MAEQANADVPARDAPRQVLLLLACLIAPAALTFLSIEHPGHLVFPPGVHDPTPLGYTWSLLLFAVPDLVLGYFLWRHPNAGVEFKAFLETTLVVFVVGCGIDFLLSYEWFDFPNQGAVLGLRLPAFSWSRGWVWVPAVLPIEEFGFYSLGSVFMMGLYAWGDVSWFGRYRCDEHAAHFERHGKVVRFHAGSAAWGLGLIAAAILYKKLWGGPGFPGYLCFLIVIGVLPPLFTLKTVTPLINWQAFSFMYCVLLLFSVIWEATLGVPYDWWNYRHEQMLGIYIGPWRELPIEAVLMWLVAAWAVVIFYEMFRLIRYSGRSWRAALFGAP